MLAYPQPCDLQQVTDCKTIPLTKICKKYGARSRMKLEECYTLKPNLEQTYSYTYRHMVYSTIKQPISENFVTICMAIINKKKTIICYTKLHNNNG